MNEEVDSFDQTVWISDSMLRLRDDSRPRGNESQDRGDRPVAVLDKCPDFGTRPRKHHDEHFSNDLSNFSLHVTMPIRCHLPVNPSCVDQQITHRVKAEQPATSLIPNDYTFLSCVDWVGTNLAFSIVQISQKGGEDNENSKIRFGSSASRW